MIVGILILWQVIGLAVEAIVIPPMLIKTFRRISRNEQFEQAVEKSWKTTKKVVELGEYHRKTSPDMESFYVTMKDVLETLK